jgi:hypothetical protein
MEHPFVNNLDNLSLDELQEKISSLSSKLTFTSRMHNHSLSSQLIMILDSYKNELNKRMDDMYKKQNIENKIQISKNNT